MSTPEFSGDYREATDRRPPLMDCCLQSIEDVMEKRIESDGYPWWTEGEEIPCHYQHACKAVVVHGVFLPVRKK